MSEKHRAGPFTWEREGPDGLVLVLGLQFSCSCGATKLVSAELLASLFTCIIL